MATVTGQCRRRNTEEGRKTAVREFYCQLDLMSVFTNSVVCMYRGVRRKGSSWVVDVS